MPIYEYQCVRCGHGFEALVRRAEEKPACPACGARKLKKQHSVFAPGPDSARRPPAGCAAGGACPMSGGGCPGGSCGLS